MDSSASEFLQPASIVDSDHPEVVAYARRHAGPTADPRERAVSLYYAVRDGFRYDPYAIDVSVEGLRASSVLRLGHGWCVTKAALLAAGCRALGIPAKVGFADVRNHLSTERMRRTMQTDVFYWHGYTAILLDGQWVKATPAFNIGLCERFRLKPLEFDGREDSIYHPYDLAGNRHMEYLAFRGEHLDVPWQEMRADFERLYPTLPRLDQASFDADVAAETVR
ncbi:transglutaminase family protein [Solimonas fluminis]|uniref:Transglutaminase family protein n=1 Tax=Solimonas fluminis TaxID=2086571 RepID=A0A2S5TLF3_9GAMM|nr:transglutaminase family protein [Solimonas fluminis]PPE75588.1 transglutaminase family protein [Solimonas fluminis]